ncbi:hypothetical protein PU088_001954 [Citrobacter farmeri]|uniref:Uncharacterized protein n=1 Tax=Citrobacter amalonaticus Y19 TaxID=1261127 RepID=M1KGP4_CITAM|nr:hypothetical protein [Citrobacter amalonaticus]AGE94339.1 hypothetical protein F384_08460 [Citrobacter amalonaticus Y19]EKV5654482.1 hypothetical protein [Citrobacter farmeri]
MTKILENNRKNALIAIRDLLAKEVYKLAVIKQYPQEFACIIEIYTDISRTFQFLEKYTDSETISRFKEELLNCVIIRPPMAELKTRLQNCVDDLKRSTEEPDDELSSQLKKGVNGIFTRRRTFQSRIPHRYPPALLIHWYDFISVYRELLKWENKNGIRRVWDDTFDIGHVTQITAPVSVTDHIRAYDSYLPMSFHYATEHVAIPENAWYRNVAPFSPEIPEEITDELIMLQIQNNYSTERHVEIKTELNFSVRLYPEMTQAHVDEIVEQYRYQLTRGLNANLDAEKQLACDQSAFMQSSSTAKLKEPDFTDLRLLQSARLIKIDNLAQGIKYVYGLALLQEAYLEWHQDKSSAFSWCTWKKRTGQRLDMLAEKVAEEIETDVLHKVRENEDLHNIRLPTAAMIKNSYDDVSLEIQKHIDQFQRGRLQMQKRLNPTQMRKLMGTPEIQLSQLHEEDIDVARQRIAELAHKGKTASVRRRENGSFVIVWF